MTTNRIEISLELDAEKIPQSISWTAGSDGQDSQYQAKAMMLSFWDGADRTSMRLDLWTRDMMVDEMSDFFYQTLMTMADTYKRATHAEVEATEIIRFAQEFRKRFQEKEKAAQAITP